MNKRLAVKCLKEGWDLYLENASRVIPASLVQRIFALIIPVFIWKYAPAFYVYLYLVFVVLAIDTGMNLFFIKISRGEKALYSDIFAGFKIYKKATLTQAIFALLVAGGTIMFIIPGIVLATTFAFAEYAIIDKKASVRGSFLYSARIATGFRPQIFILILLTLCLQLAAPDIIADPSKGKNLFLSYPGFWPLVTNILIFFVFAPWLDIAMAKAYAMLDRRK